MSSIDYGAAMHKSRKGSISNALRSYATMHESFASENINIMSESVVDVLRDEVSFTSMTNQFLESVADQELNEQLTTLMNNSRKEMLSESFLSGISPITALSLPILRVAFPKMAVREGLPTEPVEQPKFTVNTRRGYVLDANRNKLYLPNALTTNPDLFGLPKLKDTAIAAASGVIKDFDLLAPIGKSSSLGDEIDPDFAVTTVTIGTTDYAVEFRLDTTTNVVSGDVLNPATKAVVAKVFGSVDRAKGLFSATAIGATLASVKIRGYVSSEANNSATQIGFDITPDTITIGTGQPIESPISIQTMQDVMNSYQLDATMVHLETMSGVLAQSIDIKGVKFLVESFQKDPSAVETFDVVPPANFNQGETAWRDQIRIKFDRLVTKMQTRTNIYSGHAVIFAHPLDAQVVSNVKWTYAPNEQPNDVAVDYKVATFQSSVTGYTLLQSPHFTQGKMLVVYIPSDPEFRTSTYFPYSFTTVRGASSPNTPNIPAIQMLQRSVFKTFTPMIGELTIQNNG